METLNVLQILVSILLFANKIYVLMDKKVGWLLGALGTVTAIIYLGLLELYIFTVLELGLAVMMVYGLFKKDQKNPAIERAIKSVIVITSILTALFVFNGSMTILELIGSLGLLFGTHQLVANHRKIFGWTLYLVAHTATGYLGYLKGQDFFTNFQIGSAIISLVGIHQCYEVKKQPLKKFDQQISKTRKNYFTCF